MIDAHCHLEQKDFLKDLNEVIETCKTDGLKAVVTVCADPKDFDRALEITKQFRNYIYLCAAVHPEYIKDFNSKQTDEYFDRLKGNKKNLVAIGECGLDYYWIKEEDWREKQKQLFIQHIELSKELKLPLVVHTRDAWEDCLKILEQEDVKKAVLHLWGGKNLMKQIVDNNYSITVGPSVARNKNRKKIVRDTPIENIMLETDSPWFGNGERGIPTNIKIPCEEIAEIKNLTFEEVWNKTGNNAIEFFSLKQA